MMSTPKLIVVVGAPGSGKDLLIRAVKDMGSQHAQIVPKHTSRRRRPDDGSEMICPGDRNYDLKGCDVTYKNYKDCYGIESNRIWQGLRRGVFQLVVVSNPQAINELRRRFGELLVLVYVHSEMTPEEYLKSEDVVESKSSYVRKRAEQYQIAFDLYLKNFLAFDHVLIYSGIKEDLFDQIFRLFRGYEQASTLYN